MQNIIYWDTNHSHSSKQGKHELPFWMSKVKHSEHRTRHWKSSSCSGVTGGTVGGGTVTGGTVPGDTATGGIAAQGTVTGGTVSGETATGGIVGQGTVTGGTLTGGTITGGTVTGLVEQSKTLLMQASQLGQ